MTTISRTLRFRLLHEANYTCRYCGRSAPEVRLEIDHVYPRAHGGGNALSNLVVACYDCNRGKRDRVITAALPVQLASYSAQRRYRGPSRTEWRQVANLIFPDAFDMVEPAIGDGPYASVSWCGPLTVHLHRDPASAEMARQQISALGCGHACTPGGLHHEFVDLSEGLRLERREELTEWRVEHFSSCLVCRYVFDGKGVEAAERRLYPVYTS